MGKNNYIWIFGENHGATTNNNSYFFWKHAVNIKDDIDKYIIFKKNEKTLDTYKKLSKYEKKFVIWKNSKKHFKLYLKADMFFVTLSYKDITPNRMLFREFGVRIKKPVVYLRHGTTGMKRTYYTGKSYWNNMFRFLSYNTKEPEHLAKYNDFKPYQIFSNDFHPRYGEFTRKDEKCEKKNQILWFLTWREYFGKNSQTKIFTKYIKDILESDKLKQYLKSNNLILRLCVHQFFDEKTFKDIYSQSKEGLIEIVHSKNVDVMDEMVKSKLLITDYSSVAYDFTFLNRPVLLYQPDLEVYSKTREFFCEISELEKYNIKDAETLIEKIINEKHEINPFFRQTLPDNIDYDYIKKDNHINKLYKYFAAIQENKITILGLNFYEDNDVVNSTMKLAEDLLYAGYLVEAISLYKPEINRFIAPYGLNMKSLYFKYTDSKKDKLNQKIHSSKSQFNLLKYDSQIDFLHPTCEYKLNKLIKNIKSKTVISTRETTHLFLSKCKSDKVKNKIYLFPTPVESQLPHYKELFDKIKSINIEKSLFISSKDIEFYENNLHYKTPSSKIILDDFICENQTVKPINLNSKFIDDNYKLKGVDAGSLDEEEILEYELLSALNTTKKEKYYGLCLIGINKYYSEEINSIIDFGKYLKENGIEDIKIDIVGNGDYSENLLKLIAENELFNYIDYLGSALDVTGEIRQHDFILDLSTNPNTNLHYLQGALNYKKVFCIKNPKSEEIFKDIPNTFIESYDWLCKQIYNLNKTSFKELDNNYKLIYSQHDQKLVSKKLKNYINN